MDKHSQATKSSVPQPSRLSRLLHAGRRLRRPIAAIAAAGAVLGGLVGYWNAYRAIRTPLSPDQVVAASGQRVVQPDSAADRRMTFAVLPFAAPTGDGVGQQLAAVTAETMQSLVEEAYLWSRATPRTLVEQAAAKPSTLKQLGTILGVRFLIRGNVFHGSDGYRVELAVIEVDTERVINTSMLRPGSREGESPTIRRNVLNDARSTLTYEALKAEVALARGRADSTLDARDLAYRAYVDWGEADNSALGYSLAKKSLDQALKLASSEPVALYISAKINTCDCLYGWAPDLAEKEKIGTAALDRFLSIQADKPDMLVLRSYIFVKHSRFLEALAVLDEVLRRDKDNAAAWHLKALVLLRLERTQEARSALVSADATADEGYNDNVAAAVNFTAGDYESAARFARRSTAQMSARQRANPWSGAVALTLIAAEARAGHMERAKAAFEDFHAAVPAVRTVVQVKAWLIPTSPVPNNEAFFDALKLAGFTN